MENTAKKLSTSQKIDKVLNLMDAKFDKMIASQSQTNAALSALLEAMRQQQEPFVKAQATAPAVKSSAKKAPAKKSSAKKDETPKQDTSKKWEWDDIRREIKHAINGIRWAKGQHFPKKLENKVAGYTCDIKRLAKKIKAVDFIFEDDYIIFRDSRFNEVFRAYNAKNTAKKMAKLTKVNLLSLK